MKTRGQPSTEGEQVMKIQKQDKWMTLIIHYLKEGWLLEDRNEAQKIQVRVAHFVIIDDVLYKQGHSFPYLQCANKEEVDYILREIYEGVCSNHARARSLAGKALRAGYCWPKL